MNDLFGIAFAAVFAVAILVFLLFLLSSGMITTVFAMIVRRAAVEWADNERQPLTTHAATVVGKRSHVSGGSNGPTWTTYYCTFQFANGDRREFAVAGAEYGLLAEGDEGELTFQGTRYHGFARRGPPA